jgi:glyoxylase-like metal-dependent hydrolase (beta-lactamase superfamily II)
LRAASLLRYRQLAEVASLPALDLGGVTVQVLRDAHGSFTTFEEAFPSVSDENEAVGRARYSELFDGDRWLLPFCAFLIRSRAATVLVDAGVGPPPGEFLPERQGWLPTELRRAGVSPEDVEAVILTHLHVDHVGWAAVDGNPFFAQARYVVSGVDWRFFANRDESQETFATKLAPLERAGVLTLVKLERAEVAPGVVLRPTPGHTPGHVSVEVRGERRTAFVIGDVAVHPLQLHDPRLPYAFDEDAAIAAATRESVFRDLADADVVVAAGHFPVGLGRVGVRGRGFAWHGGPDAVLRR